MVVWLLSTFFGRLIVTALVWTSAGLIITDAIPKWTTRSGRISVRLVLVHLLTITSIPAWVVFLLFGFFWIELPGQITSAWNQPIQTTWGYFIDILWFFSVWYAGVFVSFSLLGITSTGLIDFMFRNDPQHQAWRRGGGQSFVDNLPSWLNTDTDNVRNSIPPSPPPSVCCPNCQGELSSANGLQCGNCGLYWNGYQWLVPPQA